MFFKSFCQYNTFGDIKVNKDRATAQEGAHKANNFKFINHFDRLTQSRAPELGVKLSVEYFLNENAFVRSLIKYFMRVAKIKFLYIIKIIKFRTEDD